MEQSFEQNDCEKVVSQYGDMVYRLALARCGVEADAEDIFQDVFIRYIRSAHKITSEEHRKAWLIRTTINCSKSLFTSAWRRKTVPLSETISFQTEEKSEVYYAVQGLPLKYRTVIHLFYFENCSIRDISEMTHTKETTVKSQLSRARNMLREQLGKEKCDV